MNKINDLIAWYQENSARKEFDYIEAHLNLVNNLFNKMDNFEDKMYIDKIIDTFCEIVKMQGEVIKELEIENIPYDNDEDNYTTPNPNKDFLFNNYIGYYSSEYTDDRYLQNAFTNYCLEMGKSTYTINDYCSRIKTLWKIFYNEYEQGNLKNTQLNTDKVKFDAPLINVYNNIEAINKFIISKNDEAQISRNWANTRAAFNKFYKFYKFR